MKTNELKKGTVIVLNNGWRAKMLDNMRGNTRMAEVHGICTEAGSVYSHDIAGYIPQGQEPQGVELRDIPDSAFIRDIEYTKSQEQCRALNRQMFG